MSMNVIISLTFAAGATAFGYSKFGQRVGYGNTGNIWKLFSVVFVIVFLVFYIMMTYILHIE